MVLVLRHGKTRRLAITASIASRVVGLLLAWRGRTAEQRYLAGLSDRDLNDLGLTRSDVTPDVPPRFWVR